MHFGGCAANHELSNLRLPVTSFVDSRGKAQATMCGAVNRVRGRCGCTASSCRRRAKFSRTRPSRERKELTIHRGDAGATQSWQEYYRNYRIQFRFSAKSFVLQMYVLARQCVQEKQICSVGGRPTGAKVRSPLARAEQRAVQEG